MARPTFIFVTSVSALFALVGCGGVADGSETDMEGSALMNNGGGVTGGACHVVAGPNSGKSGTYDSEGSCCSEGPGGWGCTDCVDSGGKDNGKCKDGAAIFRAPIDRVPIGGGVLLLR
jgi:hypothetical protein